MTTIKTVSTVGLSALAASAMTYTGRNHSTHYVTHSSLPPLSSDNVLSIKTMDWPCVTSPSFATGSTSHSEEEGDMLQSGTTQPIEVVGIDAKSPASTTAEVATAAALVAAAALAAAYGLSS